MVQTLTTTSTLTPSLWAAVGAASKHDAAASDDGDTSYIRSTTGGAQVQAFGLSAATDPVVHTGHKLRLVYRREPTQGNPNTRIGVQLLQGATPITGVERAPTATSEWATFDYDLTTSEAAAISDYGGLVVHVVSPDPLVSGFDALVTYVALIVPDYSEALVAWTLAEGASDAVAGALTAGINAKLAVVNARYSDGVTVPDVTTVHQSARAIAGPIEHWPAIGVWPVSGATPMLNAAGHGLGSFRVRVACLVKGQDNPDDVQRQAQRLALSVLETLRDAYVDGGALGGWDLMAETPTIQYSSRELAQSEWTGEAHITLGLSKLEVI